jgi:Organic solute transporter Ostalpha
MYDKNADCPSDAFYGTPVQPVAGSMSFHTLSTIISAVCTVLAILLGLGLALLHLSRYTKREEQRQIVRISITPAVISVFCFFGVWFQNTSGFIKPIGEYYECIALVAVYLLFLTFSTPLQQRGHSIFNNLPTLQERNGGADMSTYYVCSPFPAHAIFSSQWNKS